MSLFFERLQCLCREYKSSPNAVAAKLGLSSGSVTAWKRGTLPRGETMQKLADFFHVSVDYLLGNVSEPYFYLDNERILRELNSYEDGTETEKAPTPEGEPIHLSGTYLRLAQGAQELGLDDEDVDAILAIYKKHLQKNQ